MQMDPHYISQLLAESLEMKRTRRKPVEDKLSRGECLIKGCDCPSHTRGLCSKHYAAFSREKARAGSKQRQIAFEADATRAGLILPPQEVREYRRTGPFSKIG